MDSLSEVIFFFSFLFFHGNACFCRLCLVSGKNEGKEKKETFLIMATILKHFPFLYLSVNEKDGFFPFIFLYMFIVCQYVLLCR